jgi:hypothetical protein
VLTESLKRIAKEASVAISRRPGVLLEVRSAKVIVVAPREGIWIEVEVGESLGFSERIKIMEYRWNIRQEFFAGSPWEAVTKLEQILD